MCLVLIVHRPELFECDFNRFLNTTHIVFDFLTFATELKCLKVLMRQQRTLERSATSNFARGLFIGRHKRHRGYYASIITSVRAARIRPAQWSCKSAMLVKYETPHFHGSRIYYAGSRDINFTSTLTMPTVNTRNNAPAKLLHKKFY